MSFADAVRTLANQIQERRQHVATEEATKQALILPFIALLGFDATEEELAFFDLVVRLVQEHVPDPAALRHQDTERYFSVLYAKSTGWFTRFVVQRGNKKLIAFRLPAARVRELVPGIEVDDTPSWMGTCRIAIKDLSEVSRLQDVFIAAVREVA